MISGADDGTLRLWNTPTFQCVTMIEGVECLDKDRVIVCGKYTFSIVNIDKCVSLGCVVCFIK